MSRFACTGVTSLSENGNLMSAAQQILDTINQVQIILMQYINMFEMTSCDRRIDVIVLKKWLFANDAFVRTDIGGIAIFCVYLSSRQTAAGRSNLIPNDLYRRSSWQKVNRSFFDVLVVPEKLTGDTVGPAAPASPRTWAARFTASPRRRLPHRCRGTAATSALTSQGLKWTRKPSTVRKYLRGNSRDDCDIHLQW